MMQKESMAPKSDVQPRAETGFSVASSPLNAVKFDLAIILFGGLLLLLTQYRLADAVLWQLLILLSYGICGMLWIILRTRRLLVRIERQSNKLIK